MLNRQAKPGEGGQVPHTERMKIYLAELGEKADSSVQGGTRPVIVLQNNAGNRSSPTVIVAPITSKFEKPHLPTHVVLGQSNLPKQSMVLLEQVMTIDQKLLIAVAKNLYTAYASASECAEQWGEGKILCRGNTAGDRVEGRFRACPADDCRTLAEG